MRNIVRELDARLPGGLKDTRAGQHGRSGLGEGELHVFCHLRGQGLAIPFRQGGLWIEKVQLARTTLHEHEDDVLCLGRQWRLFRSQRIYVDKARSSAAAFLLE